MHMHQSMITHPQNSAAVQEGYLVGDTGTHTMLKQAADRQQHAQETAAPATSKTEINTKAQTRSD